MNKNYLSTILSVLFLGICNGVFAFDHGGFNLDDPYHIQPSQTIQDTIPLRDRFQNKLIDENYNPFDLEDPDIINKEVEYDSETGQYIITEKIGDEYYRMPTYMTFEEYMDYKAKEQEKAYFNELSGVSNGGISGDDLSDPIKKLDIEDDLLDRLFGGTGVEITPQGNIDLTFGFDRQFVENPILTERQRRTGGFDFDMAIQMSVQGKIGEKLNLGTNYNTQATFDFENQMKLAYDSEQFSEDEIIKKIEAGNVSLPLRSNLIQGSQSLFGLKTELQFGRLWLTAIASQQKSRRDQLQIQGGSQIQEFEAFADEYDENRHFFLSFFNRNQYEPSLRNLPQINSLFKITRMEVWITNDRNVTEGVRDIVALADIGEGDPNNLTSENVIISPTASKDIFGQEAIPDNESNNLYRQLQGNRTARYLDNAVGTLQSPPFNFQQAKDFEKVRARLLSPTEYSFHPELGFVSVNVNIRPDQVLGVAYQYTYNGEVHQVGEFSTDVPINPDTLSVLYTKLLKSTTPRVDLPAWDLMMKNVYSIGAFQVNREDFKLDVFYEDPGEGEKRFLPESNLAGTPLIRVFNLDNLNSQGDPLPDGVFDFVPGVTIDPRGGRIIFPVLEPFGSSLADQIEDPALKQKFSYDILYDSTVTRAREYPEFNRFKIAGTYKSSVSSEIQLGAFNLPPGSVTVSAGAQQLVEGVDYEVDYNIGRIKILNDAILNSGVPVNVSFEDNTLFGFQTKTMLGLRADYRFSEDVSIGGTYMHLFERPFTQKVNIGDDPINNKIVGLDVSINKNAPWLTKAIDRLPLIETKAESSVSFLAEGAVLKPGHSRAINQGDDKSGSVYLDDFEGSASTFDLRTPANAWFLASTPQNDEQNNNDMFPESQFIDTTLNGVNRALLNWYRLDPSVRCGTESLEDSYCAGVRLEEVFPNRQITPGQTSVAQSFNLSYYPEERGPYNFDLPNGGTEYSEGMTADGRLVDPGSRWAGIQRALNTNNFEAANIEYLEFWVLSPFIDDAYQRPPDNGKMFIEIGNISEDILRDSRLSFENGLPNGDPENQRPFDETSWGRIPRVPPITNAFDNDPDKRVIQDVGLDGLDDTAEQEQFRPILNEYQSALNPAAYNAIVNDPANDNFAYFNDALAEAEEQNTGNRLRRYTYFNNSQGNSRPNPGNTLGSSGTNIPDSEDLNRDNTLSETESYFQYELDINRGAPNQMELNEFITESRTAPNGRTWYRFKIPLDQYTGRVGGIQDFRSIRFIRMYLKEFERPINFRFASFELVRNQWRRYQRSLKPNIVGPVDDNNDETLFDVNAVNIEENSSKTPFNYVLPPGIAREQSLGAFPNVLQNEQALSLEVCNLKDGDARAIYKILNLDMRVFERLQMFVHAETEDILNPGDMSMFIRLGSDYEENYYEYEIPLTMSREDQLPAVEMREEYKEEVWRFENELDFELDKFKDLKVQRNNSGAIISFPYDEPDPDRPQNTLRVKGNPNLGLVKGVMIGLRNRQDDGVPHCAEMWVNELRVNGFDERGGGAALARFDMQLADLGNVSLSGNYSSIGWGALEQKVAQRQREEVIQYDAATTLELSKLLPEQWGLRIPFYASISSTLKNPEFDPYDLDIPLKEKLAASTSEERDSIRQQAGDYTTIKSMNFTNVRKERTSDGNPMPWDISNFSFTYAYTGTEKSDPIIESDERDTYRGAVNYSYSMKPLYITPFKKLIKGETLSKQLKLIKDANLNIIPNTFSFSTAMDRTHAKTKYRFAGDDPFFNTFYDKRFTWDRTYDLNWNITKALTFTFNAANLAVIDELNNFTPEGQLRSQQELDDFIKQNIRDLGRNKSYNHNLSLSYSVPLKSIPLLDWINLRGSYGANYAWDAAALNVDSLGNVIQNSQNRQISADLNFEKLYNKSKYLKSINKGKQKKTKRGSSRIQRDTPKRETTKTADGKTKKTKKAREPSGVERALLRPLMLVRKAKASYSENYTTVIPGYTPSTRFFGMNEGFSAPGWDFVAGLQPDRSFLDDAAANGRITTNIFQNQEVLQNYTQNINANVTIEPFKDFRVDVEASRQFTENHTELFKVTEQGGAFQHLAPRDIGSLTTTFYGLNTLFERDLVGLFKTFENNRIEISQRLGAGSHDNEVEAQQGFTDGFGRYQNEVLIPAFLSAYTNNDPSTYDVGFDNLFNFIPRPNWRLSYNGLDKLPVFEDIFSSVRLNHAYRSSMTINSFNTDLDFDSNQPTIKNENTFNYFSRYEIPGLTITESFSPLVGLDMNFENDMNIRFDWSKARDLQMSFTDYLLSETKTEEFTVSFGYTKKDVYIKFLKPKGGTLKQQSTKRSRKAKKKDKDGDDSGDPDGGAGKNPDASDLNFKFDFSFRDDVTINYQLDQPIAEPTRGLRTIRISPSVDYDINENLNLRLFFDYSKTNPKTSASFPITSTQGGLVVRFTLN